MKEWGNEEIKNVKMEECKNGLVLIPPSGVRGLYPAHPSLSKFR